MFYIQLQKLYLNHKKIQIIGHNNFPLKQYSIKVDRREYYLVMVTENTEPQQ